MEPIVPSELDNTQRFGSSKDIRSQYPNPTPSFFQPMIEPWKRDTSPSSLKGHVSDLNFLPLRDLHSPIAGDLAISNNFRQAVEEGLRVTALDFKTSTPQEFRQATGVFAIEENTIILGSFRHGGIMPDVRFRDFLIPDRKPPISFLQQCKEFRKLFLEDDEKFIDEVKKLVSELINSKVIIQNEKKYEGRDYNNPLWKSDEVKEHITSGKPMDIGRFAELGFGDCRITNGLLAFGLSLCGLKTRFCYCGVIKYPLFISSKIAKAFKELAAKTYLLNPIKKLLRIPCEDHAVVLWTKNDRSFDGSSIVLDAYFGNYDGYTLDKVIKGVGYSSKKLVKSTHTPVGERKRLEANKSYRSAIDHLNFYPKADLIVVPPSNTSGISLLQHSLTVVLPEVKLEALQVVAANNTKKSLIKEMEKAFHYSDENFTIYVKKINVLDAGSRNQLYHLVLEKSKNPRYQDETIIDSETYEFSMRDYIAACRLRILASLLAPTKVKNQVSTMSLDKSVRLALSKWMQDPSTSKSCAAQVEAEQVEVVPSTEKAWPKILDLMSLVQSTISLETYVLAPTATKRYPHLNERTAQFFMKLAEISKAKKEKPYSRPIKVRIIVDYPQDLISKKTQASGGLGGVDVPVVFSPYLKDIDPKYVEVSILGYTRISARAADHAKLFQIDDIVVFTSANMANYTNDSKKPDPDGWGAEGWTDTQETYTFCRGPSCSDIIRQRLNVVVQDNCTLLTSNQEKATVANCIFLIPEKNSHEEAGDESRSSSTSKTDLLFLDQCSQPGKGRLKLATAYRNTPIQAAMIAALRKSKSSICIATPNLQSPDFLEELKHALVRGVKVQIVLPERMNAQVGQSLGLSNGQVKDMLEAFAKAVGCSNNLKIKWYRNDERKVSRSLEGGNHVKLIIVDDRMVLQGSHNCDVQSVHSREVCLCAYSQKSQENDLIGSYRIFFEHLLNIGSDSAKDEKKERPSLVMITKIARAILYRR